MRPSGAGRTTTVAVLVSQVLLVCQVLQQKLLSLNGVSALLLEHNHDDMMLVSVACAGGGLEWFRTDSWVIIGVKQAGRLGPFG